MARREIEHGDGAILFRRNKHSLSIRVDPNSFGLTAYLDRLQHCPRGDVNDAHRRHVFIRNKKLFAVFADIKVLRI
ncbi:MAG TPA: hypothetical protein VMQ17_17145 [Candidatus Sulfotelmatobacter sp.]|nr:hypothetical protein [Candidatus Sulfotelmatobacter sp.]